jgi:hypothetical protein
MDFSMKKRIMLENTSLYCKLPIYNSVVDTDGKVIALSFYRIICKWTLGSMGKTNTSRFEMPILSKKEKSYVQLLQKYSMNQEDGTGGKKYDN